MRNRIDSNKEIVNLLRFIIAIDLWKSGVSQDEIAKRLGIAKGSVNRYVKGVKRITELQ
jgi:predicted transcriptional regulator